VSTGYELEVKEEVDLVGIRGTIAERMKNSYQNIPQLAITIEVSTENYKKLLDTMQEAKEKKILFTALLVKILSKALERFPELNSSVEKDKIYIFKQINIGVAVSIEDGLLVPVIKNANEKKLLETSRELSILIEKARNRELTATDLSGGTFTISNLGALGVKFFTPIINPPESAILGVGAISEKLSLHEGQIMSSEVMNLTLVFDHRVVDGVKAGLFLKFVKEMIEDPFKLFIDSM
jgi:pyruvate dehydrogenase E2 component (dihydrolipoamide acetyltransferase)